MVRVRFELQDDSRVAQFRMETALRGAGWLPMTGGGWEKEFCDDVLVTPLSWGRGPVRDALDACAKVAGTRLRVVWGACA